MSEWRSSDLPWESHDRDYWNQALQLAKSKKWFFKYSGKNHVFGWISCRPGRYHPDTSEVCAEVIYKTGESNARSVAIDAEKTIRACRHTEPKADEEKPSREEAEALVREAEILLGAASRLITARADLSDAQMLLEQAMSAEGDAIALLEDEAVAAESRADRNENLARADVSRVDVELPLEAEELVEMSEHKVDEAARAKLHDLQRSIDQARERIEQLKMRLRS